MTNETLQEDDVREVDSVAMGLFSFRVRNGAVERTNLDDNLPQETDSIPADEFIGYLRNAWELIIRDGSALSTAPVVGVYHSVDQIRQITSYVLSNGGRIKSTHKLPHSIRAGLQSLEDLAASNSGNAKAEVLGQLCYGVKMRDFYGGAD